MVCVIVDSQPTAFLSISQLSCLKSRVLIFATALPLLAGMHCLEMASLCDFTGQRERTGDGYEQSGGWKVRFGLL